MIKHLLFDPETVSNTVYADFLKAYSPKNGTEPQVKIVFDLRSFKKALASPICWYSISINVSAGDFFKWKAFSIKKLIESIKKSQKMHGKIVGITSYSTQKILLEKLGLRVVTNKYNGEHINSQVFDVVVPGLFKYKKIKEILEIVCDYFDLDPDSVQKKGRKDTIVSARHITSHFCRKFLKKLSLKEIGAYFEGDTKPGRDHTSVIHSCKVVQNRMDSDPGYKAHVLEIERRLCT